MNEMIKADNLRVKDMIYEFNGVEVMLDTDLARLYGVETKRINEAVSRNKMKFPGRYAFKISELEYRNLKSQFSTSSLKNNYGGARKGHIAFTEQGVYMLATILRSERATEVSIRIMDTFVKMRHYINYNNNLLPNRVLLLEEKVDENTKRIDELFDKFSPKDIVKNKIFFKSEFYDAYSLLLEILNNAKKEIIIIDNYSGKELLDILKRIDKKVIIISKNIDKTLKDKYEKQYKNITFKNMDSFHDRFIIIDRSKLYSCGASFKDLGKKCFAINEFYSKEHLNQLLQLINKN